MRAEGPPRGSGGKTMLYKEGLADTYAVDGIEEGVEDAKVAVS